jgi:hypothetical protein
LLVFRKIGCNFVLQLRFTTQFFDTNNPTQKLSVVGVEKCSAKMCVK